MSACVTPIIIRVSVVLLALGDDWTARLMDKKSTAAKSAPGGTRTTRVPTQGQNPEAQRRAASLWRTISSSALDVGEGDRHSDASRGATAIYLNCVIDPGKSSLLSSMGGPVDARERVITTWTRRQLVHSGQ